MTPTHEPLNVATVARYVWHDFRHGRRVLLLFEFGLKLLEAWLLLPLVALALAAIMARSGQVAVSNTDILDFVLTPLGSIYAALLVTVAVALQLFEQAGLMVLVALIGAVERPSFRQLALAFIPKTIRIIQLGAIQAGLLALALAPFVLTGFLTYRALLTEHDIYFYLKERPQAFWNAAMIGGVLLVGALIVTLWLYVRWSFALPLVLFEHQSPRQALKTSKERVRGIGWRVCFLLFGWVFAVMVLGIILETGFRFIAVAVLQHAGERPVVLIILLLVVQGAILATVSFVLTVGFSLINRRLYLLQSKQLGVVCPDEWIAAPGRERPASPWDWRLAWLSMPLLLVAPVAIWFALSRAVADRPPVRITAHRGHARAAPENTLSAFRKAIDSGADYVETDVQLTSDGVIVLLHDRDLKRVAGVSRRLDEFTYDELRKLDIGTWFNPTFASERVPTLIELIELCRGKIRINIEMKFFGPDRRLTEALAQLLREQNFEAECIVTCLNYDALMEVKRHNPKLRTGFTVAHAVGNISKLEVDALSIRADFLTDDLLRAAHRQGREVMAWTINDAGQMSQLIKRGVDNLITSDPELGVRVRDEWQEMAGTERLVLASRLLLGLNP